MAKTQKRALAIGLALVIILGSAIFSNFSLTSSAAVYKDNPVQTALNLTASDATPVSTFAQLKSAVEAGTPVRLTANITATSDIGSTKSYLKNKIVIFGDNKTLDMGTYQFLMSGSNTLFLSDLTLNTTSKNTTHRYGVFCLRDGSATTSNFVWQTGFHNLTFNGSALMGTYNTDDYAKTSRYFDGAYFSGDTNINITNAYNAHMAVVYARNINISGVFEMHDNIAAKNTGATNPTYQYYFKSPGTGGVSSETDNTYAHGSFVVEDGAVVNITRSPGQGTDGATSAYYRSLIYGYADHNFGESASFYAKAGTNLTSSSGLLYRSAVIRSNNANSFIVGRNADVKLETDLYNTTSSAAKNGSYGYTALSLKKSNNLDIVVEQGATLDIYADGRDVTPSYGTRAQAPVLIWGTGSSTTTVRGDLKVYSENANGWYYAYSTSKVGKASFIVEGTGNVDIRGNNLGVKGASEYAAFEAYGKYDVDIIVRDGGKMDVFSNGYRGMSLAGSGGFNNKNILVTGAGSELNISGVHWAIAAETQPILKIEALDGGKIDMRTTGDVGDGYSKAGSAPSTIYSVGPTTYRVDGAGSEMNIYHSGGTYSAIFHDGYGALEIYATNGGVMDVYNKNSGTDTSARRAAITAQSTYLSTYKSYDNKIVVDGEGSSLTVVNENPYTHGNGGDTGLYPTGAVSFNSSAKGNIDITNGGSFKAISSSLAPTIHLFEGRIRFDKPGDFEIRNDSLSSTTGGNKTYATSGQAVYNERYLKGKAYNTAIEFVECDVVVWSVLENDYNFDEEHIDNSWEEVTFSAKNNAIADVGKDGVVGDTKLAANQFELSAYGRINGTGEPDPGTTDPPPTVKDKSDPPTIDEVREADKEITGTGVPDAEVTIIFPDLSEETVVVGSDGKWSVKVTKYLWEDEIIYAYQVEPTLAPSDNVETIVLEYVSVPGGAPVTPSSNSVDIDFEMELTLD